MKTTSIVIATLILLGCVAPAARAQTNVRDADQTAGATAALVGMAASGVLAITNLDYSPEGSAVAGGLGVAVGVATAVAGIWWIGEAEATHGDVIGGVIVASGTLAVLTGARSVHQASRSRATKRTESVRLTPVISRDHAGEMETGIAVLIPF